SPSDAVLPEDREILHARRSRTRSTVSSRSSTSSSSSRKSPIVSAEAMRMRKCRHQCPLCEQTCRQADDSPQPRIRSKNVSDKVLEWRHRPHKCPICETQCQPESLFSSDSEDDESEVGHNNEPINLDDYLSDSPIDDSIDASLFDDSTNEEQPEVPEANLCHQCGRNCPCAPVQR
uniref:RING-type domain-containing protein n=1 Tax=Panagrellus redivivus TaxID=6233 RepID=A0A7E4W1A5_PANRE